MVRCPANAGIRPEPNLTRSRTRCVKASITIAEIHESCLPTAAPPVKRLHSRTLGLERNFIKPHLQRGTNSST
eukprot:3351592-Amphidinium_carterae.1